MGYSVVVDIIINNDNLGATVTYGDCWNTNNGEKLLSMAREPNKRPEAFFCA
jgi:hypothetical protein